MSSLTALHVCAHVCVFECVRVCVCVCAASVVRLLVCVRWQPLDMLLQIVCARFCAMSVSTRAIKVLFS